jgi:hypothetical protein
MWLLASQQATIALEGDVLLVILAMNQSHLFYYWQFTFIFSDITLDLYSFQSWNVMKVS